MKDKRIIWKQKELINHLRGFINNEIVEEGFLLPEEHDWDEFIKIDKSLREELTALESETEDEEYEPYFGWCDVAVCDNEGCCGGTGWRETGYWTLCPKHSSMARDGESQPPMKQASIKRESTRDKVTGIRDNKIL